MWKPKLLNSEFQNIYCNYRPYILLFLLCSHPGGIPRNLPAGSAVKTPGAWLMLDDQLWIGGSSLALCPCETSHSWTGAPISVSGWSTLWLGDYIYWVSAFAYFSCQGRDMDCLSQHKANLQQTGCWTSTIETRIGKGRFRSEGGLGQTIGWTFVPRS